MRSAAVTRRLVFAGALGGLILAPLAALAAEPAPAHRLGGQAERYRPLLAIPLGPTLLVPSLELGARFEAAGSYQLDRDGTTLEPPAGVDVLGRVGLMWTSVQALLPLIIKAEGEIDLITGRLDDGTTVKGVGLPTTGGHDTAVIRKAELTLSFEGYLTLRGGYTTSHWGLGLLANDGAHGWAPGNAQFNDPRGGDRVLRGSMIVGPDDKLGLTMVLAYDQVEEDDGFLEGDQANNFIGAMVIGQGKQHTAGIYLVRRDQEAKDGDTLDAWVVDVMAQLNFPLAEGRHLKLEAELAYVTGRTSLAPSTNFQVHDIEQLALAVRATYDAGSFGVVADILYASGDQNFDDAKQNGFKVDSNYEMGLLLFQQVMAGQTGRSPITASDPNLVGVPSEDLDRFPTRGSITNTLAIHPRFWWRPLHGLELYFGPLIAFADVDYSDPLNSRVNGGDPRNPINGDPGTYLGTEFDAGLRYTALLWGSELQLGIEGAVLIPGDALNDATGSPMDSVMGGRAILRYRL